MHTRVGFHEPGVPSARPGAGLTLSVIAATMIETMMQNYEPAPRRVSTINTRLPNGIRQLVCGTIRARLRAHS